MKPYPDLVLHQFEFSHFNEKARWALDYKGLDHRRDCYLPGPHIPPIKNLSGQSQTPVLDCEGSVIPGSAAIIAHLEQIAPSPALYPQQAENRETAIALQHEFDQHLGPAVRTVIFSALIEEPNYLVNMFGRSKSALKRALYRATFPLARGMIAKGNGVDDPGNVQLCFDEVSRNLDRIYNLLDGEVYLVNEGFSVADLTAAALLAPIASVDHTDMKRPQPIPGQVQQIIDKFSEHPTIRWVQQTYTNHR
ncbi:MAG: glutathione S-transferase N-terminal domain-containing protein [Pseudomonadota bacterium]